MNKYEVIRYPLITEKGTTIMNNTGSYSFIVAIEATKHDIKKAVEAIFNVNVKSVNTITIKGKTKVFRGHFGVRSDYKKAIVKLGKDQKIDLGVGV